MKKMSRIEGMFEVCFGSSFLSPIFFEILGYRSL